MFRVVKAFRAKSDHGSSVLIGTSWGKGQEPQTVFADHPFDQGGTVRFWRPRNSSSFTVSTAVFKKCTTTWKTLREQLKDIREATNLRGLLRWFDIAVVALRQISISYRLKEVWLNHYLDKREIGKLRDRRETRDLWIDLYSIVQLAILTAVLSACPTYVPWSGLGALRSWILLALEFVALYVLFEIYLNLFSIIFVPSRQYLGPPRPEDTRNINEPSSSKNRSVLLFLVNVLQVCLVFGSFYLPFGHKMGAFKAFGSAVLLLGTVAIPECMPIWLIAGQVLLNFVLVATLFATLIGRPDPRP
jgi:hypothetical protein